MTVPTTADERNSRERFELAIQKPSMAVLDRASVSRLAPIEIRGTK